MDLRLYAFARGCGYGCYGCRSTGICFALQTLEIGTNFGGALIAEFKVLFQRLVDDALQFRGQVGIDPGSGGSRIY